MSRYTFNPITNNLEYSTPQGVEIPASAYRLNSGTIVIEGSKRTSPFISAIAITLLVVLLLIIGYFLWLVFVKTENQTPTDIFSWITGQ